MSNSKYLFQIPHQPWSLWRWAGLRSAGFPHNLVLKLAAPNATLKAKALLTLENKTASASTAEMPSQVQTAKQAFLNAFEQDIRLVSTYLHQLVADDKFREAVTWQNRRIIHTGLNPLQNMSLTSYKYNVKRRKREALVARYIQRYALKNDTIGFFGPVGWAKLVNNAPAFMARHGPNLLETRNTYFEDWCIDTLAETLTSDTLRPWIAPRCKPVIHLQGEIAILPGQKTQPLTPLQALVLQQCQHKHGQQIARDMAIQLQTSHPKIVTSATQIYTTLTALCEMGLITWALSVPSQHHPERALRQLLNRIEDTTLQQTALSQLDQLEAARQGVAQASGNSADLDRALANLETIFTDLTNSPATRLHGQIYAARTLVYEDTRRNIQVNIGQPVIDTLLPPLDLLLTSARWLTHQLGLNYRHIFEAIYQDLAAKTGTPQVALVDFWNRVQTTLFSDVITDHTGIITQTLQQFQTHWATILQLAEQPANQQAWVYNSQTLRPQVEAVFGKALPGWSSARYHSPDIMIAATSPEAINQGDYQFIMGELHISVNTLRISCFVAQHPQPQDLYNALEEDFKTPRVTLIEDKNWDEFSERSRIALISPQDYRLAFADAPPAVQNDRVLPISNLLVSQTPAGLVARTRDGNHTFDIVEVLADTLSIVVASSFKPFSAQPHTPRIVLDRLVIAREKWMFEATDLDFAFKKTPAQRFLAVHRWQQQHQLPRFIFFQVPIERKPIYLDFDSPIYVDNFARLIRETVKNRTDNKKVTLSEMLPDHNHLWLTDANGQHYTSEIRLIAVDSKNPTEAR